MKPGAIFVAAAFLVVAASHAAAESGPVKKSGSGLCHCPGGQYYGRTKSFAAYPTIEACLDSGGRHPERGQDGCGKAAPAAKPKKQTGGANTRALDGDTAVLKGVTVRLQGFDAQESGQSCRNAQDRSYPCGAIATAALRLMIAAGDIRGDFEPEPGRYGRRIGYYITLGRHRHQPLDGAAGLRRLLPEILEAECRGRRGSEEGEDRDIAGRVRHTVGMAPRRAAGEAP